jgi:hypothetical protein
VTDDVTYVRGNDGIERLAQRPDVAPGIALVRAAKDDADRAQAVARDAVHT